MSIRFILNLCVFINSFLFATMCFGLPAPLPPNPDTKLKVGDVFHLTCRSVLEVTQFSIHSKQLRYQNDRFFVGGDFMDTPVTRLWVQRRNDSLGTALSFKEDAPDLLSGLTSSFSTDGGTMTYSEDVVLKMDSVHVQSSYNGVFPDSGVITRKCTKNCSNIGIAPRIMNVSCFASAQTYCSFLESLKYWGNESEKAALTNLMNTRGCQ